MVVPGIAVLQIEATASQSSVYFGQFLYLGLDSWLLLQSDALRKDFGQETTGAHSV
jgi:hypothetical protein